MEHLTMHTFADSTSSNNNLLIWSVVSAKAADNAIDLYGKCVHIAGRCCIPVVRRSIYSCAPDGIYRAGNYASRRTRTRDTTVCVYSSCN